MNIGVVKLDERAYTPEHRADDFSNINIYCLDDIKVDVSAHNSLFIKTGLSFIIPDGFELSIVPYIKTFLNYGIAIETYEPAVFTEATNKRECILKCHLGGRSRPSNEYESNSKYIIIPKESCIAIGLFRKKEYPTINVVAIK